MELTSVFNLTVYLSSVIARAIKCEGMGRSKCEELNQEQLSKDWTGAVPSISKLRNADFGHSNDGHELRTQCASQLYLAPRLLLVL